MGKFSIRLWLKYYFSYELMFLFLFLFLLVMNFLDAGLTYKAYLAGFLSEKNIIMLYLFGLFGIMPILIVKIVLLPLIVFFLKAKMPERKIHIFNYALFFICTLYFIANIGNYLMLRGGGTL